MIKNMLTILGVVIALLEIAFGIYKYVKETRRKKQYDTIRIYNRLFESLYSLREEYYKKYKDASLFEHNTVSSDKIMYKLVMNELTKWESFARGLEYEIYDLEIYISLAPKELCTIFNSLNCFVDEEIKIKNYDLLFNDFKSLCSNTTIYVENKINKKPIPKKYRKVGLK